MMTIFNIVKNNNGNKYKNICIKLKGEVGMAVPKGTQTRVVGINDIHDTSLHLLSSIYM